MDRGEDDDWFGSGFIRLMAALAAIGILGAIAWLLYAKHPVVNLRVMTPKVAMEEPFSVLAGLQQQGLIAHLGVSNVSVQQYEAAKKIAPVVCVQNLYNVAFREDDDFVHLLAAEGVPYMPYFPLGGFNRCRPT